MKSIVIANLSWNNKEWKEAVRNPKAKHSYAINHPGHESLNFDFNKKIDINGLVHGYVETSGKQFKQYENGGIFIFYSNNTDDNIGQIIGIYGNVETLNQKITMTHNGFENNTLWSNIRAEKSLSILFPIYLESEKYKKYNGDKRLVGQIGFSYYDDKNLVEEIIFDEIKLLLESNKNYSSEIEVLKQIYKYYIGEEFDYDIIEQQKILADIETIPNLENNENEFIVIQQKTYKRNNVLIAKIKRDRNFKCQICATKILKSNDEYYIEAAHIKAKKEKGNETKENILILCPNHHKEFDFGKREILKHTTNSIHFKLNDIEYELSFDGQGVDSFPSS